MVTSGCPQPVTSPHLTVPHTVNPVTPEKENQSIKRCTSPSALFALEGVRPQYVHPVPCTRTGSPRELHERKLSTGLKSYGTLSISKCPQVCSRISKHRHSFTRSHSQACYRTAPGKPTLDRRASHCYCTSPKNTNVFLSWARFPTPQSPITI